MMDSLSRKYAMKFNRMSFGNINTFLANFSIPNSLKTEKIFVFLMFSGGLEREHWPDIGYLFIWSLSVHIFVY